MFNEKKVTIIFKNKIEYTKNLFGRVENIRNAELLLIEQNIRGDCLCIMNKKYLIDIDYRDILSMEILDINNNNTANKIVNSLHNIFINKNKK